MVDEIAIVIMAAGASSRFGDDKLLTVLSGKRLIDWSVDVAVESGVGSVFVVTNPLRPLGALHSSVSVIVNAKWRDGLSSSIRFALHVLSKTAFRAAIFVPGDQPLLTPAVYQRMTELFQKKTLPLIVASFDGQARNPVLLSRQLWETAIKIKGDVGLSIFARSNGVKTIDCGDIASVLDVDKPADLIAIERLLSRCSICKME